MEPTSGRNPGVLDLEREELVHRAGESLNTLLDVLQRWNECLHWVSLGASGAPQGPRRIRRATPELAEQIWDLSMSGRTSSEIAKQLNLGDHYVRALIRRKSRGAR
jgi:hypothetical protein